MRTTPRTRRWAVLGAAAALATAAFAIPALAQGADEAPGTARPDRAGNAEPGEHHAEVLAELEGLEGDAVTERLEELYAERAEARAERFEERATIRTGWFEERQERRADRFAEREARHAERHAEVLAELEGLEGEELTEKLQQLHDRHQDLRADRGAFRADRRADREADRADRDGRDGARGDRQADRGFGPRMGVDA